MTGTSPDAQIWNLLHGALATRVLAIVTDLRISDLLEGGPRPVAELAQESGADEDALYRFLRALATDDVFAEEAAGVFRNTPASDLLRGSEREFAHLFGGVWHGAAGALDASGRPSFERLHGAGFWKWLGERPDERAVFDLAMEHGLGRRVDRLDSYPWRGDETVVDVGGGNGSLLLALLERRRGLRGIAFDLPETHVHELGDRCIFIGGSFLEEVPPGDVFVVSTVIHNWDDERAAAILRTIRAAAADDSTLVLIERVVDAATEPDGGKWLDLLLLALYGARERTEAQWRALLGATGWAPDFTEHLIVAQPC